MTLDEAMKQLNPRVKSTEFRDVTPLLKGARIIDADMFERPADGRFALSLILDKGGTHIAFVLGGSDFCPVAFGGSAIDTAMEIITGGVINATGKQS